MATELLSIDQLLSNTAEPKREFRWIISLNGIDAYTARSSALPSGSFGETDIQFINSIRYLSGKYKPDDWTLKLWDPIAPSESQKVMEWVRLNYEVISGRMGYADFYKKDLDIKLLDPPGGVASQWTLKGAWVKKADFGKLDYTSDNLIEIDLTIRYDTAVLIF